MPEPTFLFASLFVSLIGFGLFRYGRKMARPPQMVVGAVLMGCSYFLPDAGWIAGVTAALLGLLWAAVRYAGL